MGRGETNSVRHFGVRNFGNRAPAFAEATVAGDLMFFHGLHSPLTNDGVWCKPLGLRQAERVWQRLYELLAEASLGIQHLVRMDQFYPDWHVVPFYHHVRRQSVPLSPPSTSLLLPGLVHRQALLAVDAYAWASPGRTPEFVFPKSLDIPATSAFAPVVIAGERIFVAGFMAAHGVGDLLGIAPEAKVPEGHLWKGERIQLETTYIIEQKLKPALKAAGLGLQHVCKATIALRDLNDLSAMLVSWRQAFNEVPPAICVIPTSNPGFAIEDARIEINLIANRELSDGKQVSASAYFASALPEGVPVYRRSGDFLFFSALLAICNEGVVGVAERGNHCVSLAERQTEWILEGVQKVCLAEGTSLERAVKVTLFHTDMADFLLSAKVWETYLEKQPLPITAYEVNALPSEHAKVQIEICVYSPIN